MHGLNYFGTPVGPEYKKKLARNVGIAVLILFAIYGVFNLAMQVGSEQNVVDDTRSESTDEESETYEMYLKNCSALFNSIYEEFQSLPSCESQDDATCEPPLFESMIRNHEEFYMQNCGAELENWAYLSKYNDVAWASLDDRFEISDLKRQYKTNEPIIVGLDKWGYDMCDSFRIEVINRADNSIVWEKDRTTFCVVMDPAKYQKFTYKITSETNPLLVSEIGDYYFDVHVQDDLVRGHFSIIP